MNPEPTNRAERRRAGKARDISRKPGRQPWRAPNPVSIALLKRDALTNIERIKDEASIHALIGNNPAAAIQATGRILFIAMGAAIAQGYTGEEPDLRIIRGAASAAGDVTAMPHTLDQHRQALISGLEATDRLWPKLQHPHLIHSYVLLEQKLSSPEGLKLSDFEARKEHR